MLASQGQSAPQAKTAWQATRSRGGGPRDLVDGAAPLNGPNPHARRKAPETVRRALLDGAAAIAASHGLRSEEHTSELQSLMRLSYAVFCLKKKNYYNIQQHNHKTI